MVQCPGQTDHLVSVPVGGGVSATGTFATSVSRPSDRRRVAASLKAFSFDLPRSFDPLEFLTTPRLQCRADDARWLVSTILRKIASRDTDFLGCVRLHSRILRRIMYEPTMGDVIRALEQGAIETTPYCAGVKAKGFRLANRYLEDCCVRRPAVDRRLIDRLEQERQRQDAEDRRSLWLPIHHRLEAEQRRLTIDAAADARRRR